MRCLITYLNGRVEAGHLRQRASRKILHGQTMNPHNRFRMIAAGLFLYSSVLAAQSGLWPELANRVGPYSGILNITDATAAAGDGFDLTVQSTYDPAVLAVMRDLGINNIDNQMWEFIHARCNIQYDHEIATGTKRRCELSVDMQRSILLDARTRLDKVKTDPNVAGYWILDDYPWGDITATLVAVKRLVGQANKDTGKNKPTICGIGGSLDHRTTSDTPIMPDRAYIELSLRNITPAACDVIAPYFYGAATENEPAWIDWSMRSLMPWFMQRLHDKGFTRPFLLPVPQAFYRGKRGGTTYFVQPRPEDIAAQARSYCSFGAIGLLYFTWKADDAERSYANDENIRDGVRRAISACRQEGLGIRLPRTHQ